MNRCISWIVFLLAAAAVELTAGTADAAVKSPPADLINVAPVGDQDVGAAGSTWYTDLSYAYTFVFYNARGVRRSIDIYQGNLTIACAGLIPGAYCDVQYQVSFPDQGYQLVKQRRLMGDDSGNLSAAFAELATVTRVEVNRVIGEPQADPWDDTVTLLLPGVAGPEGAMNACAPFEQGARVT